MFCNWVPQQVKAEFYYYWQQHKSVSKPSVSGKTIDLMTSRVPSLKRIWTAVIEEGRNKLIETSDVIQQIKQILVDDMQLNVVRDEIPDEYSLLESGLGLDSILIAELIARIEDRFGLQLDDRVLEAELFNNLSLLAGFVAQEHLAAQCNPRNNQS